VYLPLFKGITFNQLTNERFNNGLQLIEIAANASLAATCKPSTMA
jgi:hypothetical protein